VSPVWRPEVWYRTPAASSSPWSANITGGKRGSGKTTKGDIWLLDILTQCAWAAARTRDTYRQRDRLIKQLAGLGYYVTLDKIA